MTFLYYKFPNKETVPKKSYWPEHVSVYEIGAIEDIPAVYDSLGNVIAPATYLDGWHINVAYSGEADLSLIEQYRIEVNNPKVIWLGQIV